MDDNGCGRGDGSATELAPSVPSRPSRDGRVDHSSCSLVSLSARKECPLLLSSARSVVDHSSYRREGLNPGSESRARAGSSSRSVAYSVDVQGIRLSVFCPRLCQKVSRTSTAFPPTVFRHCSFVFHSKLTIPHDDVFCNEGPGGFSCRPLLLRQSFSSTSRPRVELDPIALEPQSSREQAHFAPSRQSKLTTTSCPVSCQRAGLAALKASPGLESLLFANRRRHQMPDCSSFSTSVTDSQD